jgi:hypothetical protein
MFITVQFETRAAMLLGSDRRSSVMLLTASLGVSSAGAGAVLVGVNDLLQLSHRRRGCIIKKGQHHRFKESCAMDYHVMS